MPSAYCTNSKANVAIANFACPDIPGGDVSQPLARIRRPQVVRNARTPGYDHTVHQNLDNSHALTA